MVTTTTRVMMMTQVVRRRKIERKSENDGVDEREDGDANDDDEDNDDDSRPNYRERKPFLTSFLTRTVIESDSLGVTKTGDKKRTGEAEVTRQSHCRLT